MTATIIDGKTVADQVKKEIAQKVSGMNRKPGLAVVQVGTNPSSTSYVNSKERTCNELGFYSVKVQKDEMSEEALIELVKEFNLDDKIDGILVQLPLPKNIDANKILDLIDPEKDVDGFHPMNLGRLLIGQETFESCTPKGIMRMLESAGVEIEGKNAVVVGRSNIVGKPIAMMLLSKNATVTVCHSHTKDLAAVTRQADILVVAVGKAKFITGDMIKPGATVIDVGINRVDGKVVGDVEFESAKEVAGAISPVPGGVGKMTIAMLMENTLQAAKRHGK